MRDHTRAKRAREIEGKRERERTMPESFTLSGAVAKARWSNTKLKYESIIYTQHIAFIQSSQRELLYTHGKIKVL